MAQSILPSILIVDDEELIRETLGDLLRFAHYHVQLGANGQEALKLLEVANFDLVLTDIRMPGMDGVELLKKIRQRNLKVPVILMTGYADITLEIARDLGASDLIRKPFDFDTISETIGRHLPTKPIH